jgi:ferric-dicitrate binding protein FerR (iron transport regulator)
MRLSILRCFLCWALGLVVVPLSLLGQSVPVQSVPAQPPQGQADPAQPAGAIIHTQGGVWVNGYEAQDSSAVFPGDLIETKVGFSANLSLDGSTVQLAAESVAKFQGDLLELDHGSVSVVTSKSFKVKVKCIKVIPILNESTHYAVTDVNGTVQVVARKLDVNVEHEGGHTKPSPENEASQKASVHEGEQKNYDESQLCGAAIGPTSPTSSLSPKWIAGGAAGGGILICLVLHCFGGGGSKPISPTGP